MQYPGEDLSNTGFKIPRFLLKLCYIKLLVRQT